MQFKRITVLMLILFVLLDIFLFNWWQAGRVAPIQELRNANANIILEMKKQGIKLPGFIARRLTIKVIWPRNMLKSQKLRAYQVISRQQRQAMRKSWLANSAQLKG